MPIAHKLKIVLEGIHEKGKIDIDLLKDFTVEEKELIHTLFEEGLVSDSLEYLDALDPDKDWEEIRRKIVPVKKLSVPIWKPLLKYAAVFVGLIMTVYFLKETEPSKLEIQPGKEAITLKIGEDDIKVIEEGKNRQIVSASGIALGVQKGNRISYHVNSEVGELVYNELRIPFGRVFELELSDGTIVHLNSGSKIKYPVKFLKGKKREVFIDGEAYFKVTKDVDHPFIVNADSVAVEVLGTEFNISSYTEDEKIKTVLVEGAVSMSSTYFPEDRAVLKPGHMGAWDKSAHRIRVKEVDIELHTGWIKGELIFRGSSFDNMARKLERRYNVSIKNNNITLQHKKFNASFSVDVENIDEVIKSISEIYPFSYRILDNQIVIE